MVNVNVSLVLLWLDCDFDIINILLLGHNSADIMCSVFYNVHNNIMSSKSICPLKAGAIWFYKIRGKISCC